MGIVDDLYSGAASYGQFKTTIGFIIALIVGVVLFVVGTYFLFKKEEPWKTTIGSIVEDPNCSTKNVNNQMLYDCVVSTKYTIKSETKTQTFIVQNLDRQLIKGSNIILYYKASKPFDTITATSKLSDKTLAAILFVTGVVLIFGSWFTYYTAKHFKFAAAGQGAASIFSLFKS